MFYSQCLVSRKGPLGAIWVAAYFFKKLKKAQVKDTHIPSSVDQILQKELDALTYRVLAYLLLGVVRIYSKKVEFLFHDCNRALVRVKEFVAKEKNRANKTVPLPAATGFFSIALPERFELDAFDLGTLDDFQAENARPQEDITLKEGGPETENMDQYSMERFDTEEDLVMSTFHETFSANHNDTTHESFAHDMDIDAENIRDATEEASVKVVVGEPPGSNESSRDHQNASRHRKDPELDDMIVELQMFEDIRRAQEEDTVNATICNIVQRLVGPQECAGDNLFRDGHRENSESEKILVETSREKMQDEWSLLSKCGSPEAFPGTKEQPSGATTVGGEKGISERIILVETDPRSVTDSRDLPESIEKCRGHSKVEIQDVEVFLVSPREQAETSEVNLVNGSEKGLSPDMTISKEGSRGFNATDTPIAVTPKAPSRLRIGEGETSPQFSVIPTPAAKESSRVSRKRKCLIDDEAVIPNKVMKKMIEDSSTLLSKRRNVLHTDYSEGRIKRFADSSRSFLTPLIPYGSLNLQLLFSRPIKPKEPDTTETPKVAKTSGRKKSSSRGTVGGHGHVSPIKQSENARNIMETPQAVALSELKVTVSEVVGDNTEVSSVPEASSTAAGTANQTKTSPEMPVKPAERIEIAPETPARTSEQIEIGPETPVVSEQIEIAPETPVRESKSIRFSENSETRDKKIRPASSFTSFDEHPSVFCKENRDLDVILMNEEVNTHEREDLQKETWSARTRNVVKFLEKTFMEHREKDEGGKVSLLQLCRGRTQKESARLFYETLVLKTKGFLEVKQDHPYSDILLTRCSRLQEAC